MATIPLRLESNLCGHVSFVARGTPGMRVFDTADLVVVHSGLPSDTFNIVCRSRLAAADADRRIVQVCESFAVGGHRVPFAWWVGPTCLPADLEHRLTRAGFQGGEIEIGMAVEMHALRTAPVPPGIVVRRARTVADVGDYARVMTTLSDPPDHSFATYYARAAARILEPESAMRLYVAYRDGEPVAASEAYVANGVAGMYGVATIPGARRQGIGLAMTAVPLSEARAEGATLAVLQAAPDGTALYARLGFEPCGEFAVYQWAEGRGQ